MNRLNMKSWKMILTLCVTFLLATVMKAENPVDLGEFQPDAIYKYEAMVAVEGHYIPAQTGQIRCYNTGDILNAYKDSAHTEILESTQSYYGDSGEKVRIYPVAAGETVYFYNSFPLSSGTFKLTAGKEDINISKIYPSPEAGSLSLSKDYRLSVVFNIPVKATKCKLEINGESEELPIEVSASTLTVNWFNTILNWYREDKIKKDDTLTVTFTGIRDENDSSNRPDFGDGLGKLVLNYKMCARPTELVYEINTPASGVTDFLTYYLPGSDEGIVSLVFSSPLDAEHLPEAVIQYGDLDNQDFGMYIENPPVHIDGNTLTIDLQGVSRLPEEMVPGLPAQKTIYLRVSNIKSADGQNVLTGQMSSPYTFGFTYNLKTVVYSVAADWLPLPGSTLSSGDDMEIWVLNGHKILFDSVDFNYISGGAPATVSVPYDSLTASDDPGYEDAVIFNLKAPELNPDPDTEITVTFGGLKCADGLDHNSDIFVTYKASAAGVEGIMNDQGATVTFDLNGLPSSHPHHNIYIRNGKKIIIN